MKKIIIAVLVLLAAASTAIAANVTFEWHDGNPASAGVTGYKIFLGKDSRTYTVEHNAAKGTAALLPQATEGVYRTMVSNVADGKWYAAAVAYDANGNQSEYSAEIQFEIDTTAPVGVDAFKFIAVSKGAQ